MSTPTASPPISELIRQDLRDAVAAVSTLAAYGSDPVVVTPEPSGHKREPMRFVVRGDGYQVTPGMPTQHDDYVWNYRVIFSITKPEDDATDSEGYCHLAVADIVTAVGQDTTRGGYAIET